MLPRTLALVVLILGSLTAVLGGGYLATQGQGGLRTSDATLVTPAPPVEKVPVQTPAASAAATGAPAGGAAPTGAGAAGGGAAAAAPGAGGGGGGGGAAPPLPPPMAMPPPPPPVAVVPPPPVYPSAPAAAGAPAYAPAAAATAAATAAPVPVAPPPGTPMVMKEVTLEAATIIEVQLSQEVSTESAKPEDKIIARVLKPVVGGGLEVIPKDAPVTGVVMLVDKAGAIRGRPRLEWQFESVEAYGQRYNIVAPRLFYEGESPTGGAVAKVGTGAAGGALVGILLGGKKGAISGAAAGAAGGVTTVMTTARKAAVLPAGGTFAFKLNAPLKLNVPVPAQ